MSKSFKKVVACLLAVLMVTFSVPFSALAVDTTEYTPDIQLQFGTLFQADGDNSANWIDNYTDGTIENMKGKNATYDFALSGVSGPQLKATGTVSNDAKYTVTGLTLEAADTENVAATAGNADYELEGLAADHALKAGDAFTVTVRMDKLEKVYVATAEIGFSGNIEPLYGVIEGTGKSQTFTTGTAAQLGVDGDDADYELGIHPIAEFDPQSLYAGINDDEIGSEIRTDAVSGEQYMYAEVSSPTAASWSPVNKATQCVDENGNVTDMAGKSVMATFAFVLKEDISAANPINFWIHNGNTKGVGTDGTYDALAEGLYKPSSENTSDSAATTYSENRFVSADEPFGAAEENFGSRKMTFMGKNENVAAPTPTHTHDFTGATPVWTWADDNSSATATITCTDAECDKSEGYQLSATDSDIESTVKTAGNCTTKAVNTLTASVELNGTTVSDSKDVEGEIDANNHDYVGVYTNPTCTENGYTTYTCSRCGDSYVEYDDPDTTLEHNYSVPVSIAWDGEDAVTATVTLKCATCTATTTTAATVNSVEKSAATCTENQVITYTASYDGIDSISKDVEVANTATDHAWGDPVSVDWDSLDTATGSVKVNYVCGNDATHTKQETVIAAMDITQQQTEDDPELTKFTVTVGNFTDNKTVQTKPAAGHTTHTYTVPVSIAWDSEDAVTATVTLKCSKCDATTTTAATVTDSVKSAATCTANEVRTYTASYDGIESISKDVEIANTATDHAWNATEITWDGADAVTATANFVCGNDASHTKTEVANVEKTLKAAATKTTPAVYTYTASYDGFTSISKDVEEGEALGVNITVPKYEVGEVTVNGKVVDGTKDNTINVPYGSSVTFAVSEDAADYFNGWNINGKIISNAATYTYQAATFDMTVAPEFVVPATNTMTVVFLDKFGNTVKEFKNVTADDYAEAIAAGIPQATSFPSSKFTGWDMPDDDIRALTTSATIIAQYEDVESTTKYTVTVKNAAGADITATALDAAGFENGSIPYDTKVTVSDDSAAGWAIDGTTVATGTSYSFFVGADVTVTMLTEAEELPTTAIVGHTLLEGTDYRYNIAATRFVPAGWTLVDYGFVYGKNLTDADLNLDNEGKAGSNDNSGNVKVAHGSMTNSSNQFALNYGIKAKNAPITAKAFVVAKKGTEIKVVYSDMYTINY